MSQEPEYLETDKYFTTYDLGLASALLCLGHDLCAIDKTGDSRKAQFVFRRNEYTDQVIGGYWGGRLTLGARAYFDAIRCMKNRLHSS